MSSDRSHHTISMVKRESMYASSVARERMNLATWGPAKETGDGGIFEDVWAGLREEEA